MQQPGVGVVGLAVIGHDVGATSFGGRGRRHGEISQHHRLLHHRHALEQRGECAIGDQRRLQHIDGRESAFEHQRRRSAVIEIGVGGRCGSVEVRACEAGNGCETSLQTVNVRLGTGGHTVSGGEEKSEAGRGARLHLGTSFHLWVAFAQDFSFNFFDCPECLWPALAALPPDTRLRTERSLPCCSTRPSAILTASCSEPAPPPGASAHAERSRDGWQCCCTVLGSSLATGSR